VSISCCALAGDIVPDKKVKRKMNDWIFDAIIIPLGRYNIWSNDVV
jgi:hypothetical protein